MPHTGGVDPGAGRAISHCVQNTEVPVGDGKPKREDRQADERAGVEVGERIEIRDVSDPKRPRTVSRGRPDRRGPRRSP